MKKERLFGAAIVGLLLLNLATIGYVVFGKGRPRENRETWRYVSTALELSPQQQGLYLQMRDEHRVAMKQFTEDYRTLLYRYLELLVSTTPDSARKATLETQMASVERQKLQVTFAHFESLKAICTPEQQRRFPEMVPRLAEVLCGPVRPPREGPPDGEHP